MNKIITRFAPSPTGYLHLGGARTALFSYLFARHHGGQFELRIEDTDTERSTQASIEAIFQGMQWLGLEYDSTVKYQSQNLERYHQQIDKLLSEDKAYYCNCSKERLEKLREKQRKNGEKPRYDGKCRDLNLEKSSHSIIRFKNPQAGEVKFTDHVRGQISINNQELDDLVIARADGMPTYNFSVVVDDADMGITHVIRGDDHINNTPRQINIYQALGYPIPEFAHVPMILGDDGSRLSKRHGAVSVMQYAEDGYLPEAMLNYLVRLGWSDGDQEIFSKQQMIEQFKLSGVNKAPSSFNTSKLKWLNQQYIQQSSVEKLSQLLQQRLDTLQVSHQTDLKPVVMLFQERAQTINELAEMSMFLLTPLTGYDEKAEQKAFKTGTAEILQQLVDRCQAVDDWNNADLQQLIADLVSDLQVGFGKVGMPLRLALSGQAQGAANDQIMKILGKQQTINRLQNAIAHINNI